MRLIYDLVDIGCENLLTRRGHIIIEVFHLQRFSSTIDIAAVPHGHKPKEEYNLLLLKAFYTDLKKFIQSGLEGSREFSNLNGLSFV